MITKDSHILLMLSGGLDSIWQLQWLLKNTEAKIHVHHIHLVNGDRRAPLEAKACKDAIDKLFKIRIFEMSQSAIDDSRLLFIPFDMASVMLQAGKKIFEHWQLREHGMKPFTHLTIGTCLEEGHDWKRWNEAMIPILKGVMYDGDDQVPVPEFLLPEMVSKKQELADIGDIPFWSCRRPVRDLDEFKVCGKCGPCKKIYGENNVKD